MLFKEKKEMEQLKQSSSLEKKFIAADLKKCTGCGTCELMCAIKRENQYNPSCSRIKILRMYNLVNLAMTCRFCDNAPCVIACPQKCLIQSEKTGTIIVDEDKCDCCGFCVEVCPHGAISLHPKKETILICDLCDGEPQCIEWCPEEALSLVTQKELDNKIFKAIEKILIKETLGLSTPPLSNKKKIQNENQQLTKTEVNTSTQQTNQKKAIRKSLALLFEAFSEINPTEILVYGMFVKKHLSTMVPTGNKEKKIEKTLGWLEQAISLVEDYMLTHQNILVSINDKTQENFKKMEVD